MNAIDTYADVIEAEGLIVKRYQDDDLRLSFRFEGDRYDLVTYSDDLSFVGISARYGIPKGISRTTATREANAFTRRMKVIKATVTEDRGIVISGELFVAEPESLRPVFLRILSVIDHTSGQIFVNFRTLASKPKASSPASRREASEVA